jgi:acetyltransferase-like isoleucine patch superfamily enzyme
MFLKELYYKIYYNQCRKKFKRSYKDLRFHPSNSIFTYSTISLGHNVFINQNAYLSGFIEIGNDVLVGPGVFISSGDHQFTTIGEKIRMQGRIENEPVRIDDDVWVGAKVTIMRSVHIYEGAIIGSASIVTKDMPPYCVCVGHTCAPIKIRYTDDELRKHFKIIGKTADEAESMINLRRKMLRQFKKEELIR